MHRLFLSLVIPVLCLALTCNLASAADSAGVVSLQWENDKFGGTDRNFTNGLQATYLTGEDGVSWWTRKLAHSLPIIDGSGKLRSGWTIGQSIFTPEDLKERQLVRDDRPYAGWLYGGYALLSDTGKELETVAIDVGLIGPYAFGEPVQNNVHRLIDVQQALGWDNELRTEPGLVLTYERKWRNLFPATYLTDDFGFDVMPHIGVSLGNVFTHAAAGGVLRFGENLPSDYGPPRIRPSLPGSSFFLPPITA